MSRRLPLFLLALALLAGAAGWVVRVWRTPPREVPRRELDLRAGALWLPGAKSPFTGLMVEDYGPGHRRLSIEVRRGRVDGLSRGWYDDGRPESEETFVQGVSQGLRTRWHRNGQKKSEEHIERGILAGPYREWYDNGQLAVVMTMAGGHPEGLVDAWYPDGRRKSHCRFTAGKMVEREFFPLPEKASPAAEVARR